MMPIVLFSLFYSAELLSIGNKGSSSLSNTSNSFRNVAGLSVLLVLVGGGTGSRWTS